VLSDSLRLFPDNLQLLTARADLMLRDGRRDEAAVLVDRIAALPDPAAGPVVRQFRVLLLEAENRVEESIALLREMAQAEDGTVATQIGLVNRLVGVGDTAGALVQLKEAAARYPDDPRLATLNAALLLQLGQTDGAEAALSTVLAAAAGFLPALSLYDEHLAATGRADQAETALRKALESDPTLTQVRGMLALRLEAQGKTDAAIAEYESILAGGDNPLAANNLISLLAWTRDDAESLEKATTFARQIADLTDPAVRDTLGWLAYRQGRFGDAVLALSEAARALPDDPLVQYRYARALEAADRKDAAAAQYDLFLSQRGVAPAAQVADAEARLASLRAATGP
jgi:tetratricopeptide (TPR) repeat protein